MWTLETLVVFTEFSFGLLESYQIFFSSPELKQTAVCCIAFFPVRNTKALQNPVSVLSSIMYIWFCWEINFLKRILC